MSPSVWLKIDDRFHGHRKVTQIPRGPVRATAIGTWTLCATWCAEHRTDGVVPAHTVEEVVGTLEGAESLVAVKLWKRVRGGFQFVNWGEWQPTRSELDERTRIEREKRRESRKHAGKESPDESADPIRGTSVGHHGSPTLPVPSRPGPDPLTTDLLRRSVEPPVDNPGESGLTDDELAEAEESDRWGGYLGVNLSVLRSALAKSSGRIVSHGLALRIAVTVLERAPRKPDKPTAYVLRSIRDDWAEWQKVVDEDEGAA